MTERNVPRSESALPMCSYHPDCGPERCERCEAQGYTINMRRRRSADARPVFVRTEREANELLGAPAGTALARAGLVATSCECTGPIHRSGCPEGDAAWALRRESPRPIAPFMCLSCRKPREYIGKNRWRCNEHACPGPIDVPGEAPPRTSDSSPLDTGMKHAQTRASDEQAGTANAAAPSPGGAPKSPGATCGDGCGADDFEYRCTEPRGHGGVHKQVRKDGACTILDATWPQAEPKASLESRVREMIWTMKHHPAECAGDVATRDVKHVLAFIADVRRETIEACAKSVERQIARDQNTLGAAFSGERQRIADMLRAEPCVGAEGLEKT